MLRGREELLGRTDGTRGTPISIWKVVVARFMGTRVQYSGASMGYQVSGTLGAPIVANTLTYAHIATGRALKIVCYAPAGQTFRKGVDADEGGERRPVTEQQG